MNEWELSEWVIEWVSEWVIECHSSAPKSPWHDYVIHELKTERSPVLSTYESQGVQHIYHFMKKLRFLQSLTLIHLQFRPVKILRRSLAKIAYSKHAVIERGVQTGKPSFWTEKLIVREKFADVGFPVSSDAHCGVFCNLAFISSTKTN